jgi:hypothetical protein
VHEAGRLTLREGEWKFIPPGKTRDSLNPGPPRMVEKPGELFNLADDPGETTDLASQQPERIQEMANLLEKIRSHPDGRH